MLKNRFVIAIIMGALLGVFCIIGAQVRSGFTQPTWYLFAFWYNRVIMGIVIGFAPSLKGYRQAVVRGAMLGLIVSFAFYASTNYADLMGFIAGIVYGIIIELVLLQFQNKLNTQ